MNRHTLKTLEDCYNQTSSGAGVIDWHEVNLANNWQPELLSDRCLRSVGREQAAAGNYSDAIALLSHLIDRHPDNAIDYNNRGLVYFQSGQLLRAIADYDKAIQLDPQLASAYNNRANFYAAGGHLTAALFDYDCALDLNPSYVRGWINRGITLRELGRYEEAIENFDVAAVLGQLQGNIYAERGRTYHLWGDWNLAIADYQRALTYDDRHQVRSSPVANSRLRLQVESWLSQLLSPLFE